MQCSVKRCAILLGSLIIFANLKGVLAEVEEAAPTHKSPQLDETKKVKSLVQSLLTLVGRSTTFIGSLTLLNSKIFIVVQGWISILLCRFRNR